MASRPLAAMTPPGGTPTVPTGDAPARTGWTGVHAARRFTGPGLRRLAMPGLLLPVAVGVGGLSTYSHKLAIAACLAVAVVACVWVRPALATYLVIGVTPLTAGIDRGLAIPLLRPSEALALLVGGALAARGLVGWRTGGLPTLRLHRVEAYMLLMAAASSAVPILWMMARHREITHDDFLYALVMWKYVGVYVIVRASISTDRQVRRCLWISVAAACVVAAVAIVQSLGLFGVPRLLATYYAPFGHSGAWPARGSSTLALPAATADLLIFNLAIVGGMWLRGRRHAVPLAAAATLFVLGVLSAGEFSSALGLVVGVVCLAAVTGSPRLLLWFVPALGISAETLRPVIERRLTGFQSASGLPVSWTGRLDNLRTYFWPKLGSDWNFLFGVRPAARVPVASQATGYVWIESGYTWLLWGGGIPLLASFVLFVRSVAVTAWRAARGDAGPVGLAGIATFVAVVVTTVLMAFDPHLTYRGAADASFCLLALTIPRGRPSPGGSATRATTQVPTPAQQVTEVRT